jgi:hypothetical protein
MASAAPIPLARSLCIGMATHGDFDGVWLTIQAIRIYHREVLEDVSFVVIDNDPGGAAAAALRAIGDWIPAHRYVPFSGYAGSDVAIDQYLRRRIADGTYHAVITSPRVASQPNLLEFPDGDGALGARYVI